VTVRPAVPAWAPTVVLLGVAVVTTAASGPLIAASTVAPFAIAFWRNALAAAVLVPATAARKRPEVASVDRRTVLWCALSGVLLAAHFAAWVPSLGLTSVATATALVCTTPVWTALFGRVPVPRATWAGIAVAVAGVVTITGVDLSASPTALAGDALALAGGAFAAAYVLVGARVRATVSTTLYTTLCYAVCAVVLLVLCLVTGTRLSGYDAVAWGGLVALAVGPQLLGHSLYNHVLDRVSATVVSLVILLEVPGAALIAWVFLGQTPAATAWLGIALLVAGLAIVVTGGRRRAVVTSPA
jgi:drug/metabolite transporter (DMT)-like permease